MFKMVELISYVSEWALEVIKSTGYTGVFILSALESAAIPIPSEVVIPFSGFLVVSGKFSILGVVIVSTVANLVGSLVLFLIGRSGGRWVLENYGKYIFIHKRDLDTADRWFVKHGSVAVFWGRMLPVVRTFISLPAGVAKMNLGRFSLLTFLGALPWNLFLTLVGLKAGENWNILHNYFRKADVLIVGLILIFIIWYIWKHIKKKHV